MQQLHEWGVPGSAAEAAELVVAAIASNTAVHGRVPGRDFEVRMGWTATTYGLSSPTRAASAARHASRTLRRAATGSCS